MARKAALIGAGVIGGAWAARFLLQGWDVSVFDPDPGVPRRLGEVLARARATLPALSDGPMPTEGQLAFCNSLQDAVQGADYVQESVAEVLDLKHRIYAQVQQVAPDVLIGSSTAGFTPMMLQQEASNPGAVFVVCPLDPVYLLPVAEVVPSPQNPAEGREAVTGILREIGMFALDLRQRPEAAGRNRVPQAALRAALWLPAEPGSDHPDLQDALADAMGGPSVGRESVPDRDATLVGLLRALKDRDRGAGRMLNASDVQRRAGLPDPMPGSGTPLHMARMQVLPGWIDYNGHMTESRYLFACSEVTDAFLRRIGAGLDYVAGGHSYYSAETHIRHLGEAKVGNWLDGSVQVLGADDKRLHVFVTMTRDGQVLATLEQMLLHVDMGANRACPAAPEVLARLRPIAAAHAALPRPAGAGRHVGQGNRAGQALIPPPAARS